MKIFQLITLVSITVFFSFSCESAKATEKAKVEATNQEVETAKDININEFKELINSDAIILDVRTPSEYEAGHLPNSININFFDDDFINQVMKLDKSKTLLIHCKSGGRSSKAMSKLKGKGFSTLYNMLGGYSAWQSAGFEVIK